MNRRGGRQWVTVTIVAVLVAACGNDDTASTPAALEETTTSVQEPTVLEVLEDDGRFTVYLSLSKTADLAGAFELNNWNHTLFAPTDDAFARLSPEQMSAFESSGTYLFRVLETHIVLDVVPGGDLRPGELPTPLGPVPIAQEGDQLRFGTAPVVDTDLEAHNGLVHAVDGLVVLCTNALIARQAILPCTIGP
jgi:uncharacterized surface protein with fasciclin (FAS1) repeats